MHLIHHSFSLTKGCSNNKVKYEAVITELEVALQIPIAKLTSYDDYELIVEQLHGEYKVNKTGRSLTILEQKTCSCNPRR